MYLRHTHCFHYRRNPPLNKLKVTFYIYHLSILEHSRLMTRHDVLGRFFNAICLKFHVQGCSQNMNFRSCFDWTKRLDLFFQVMIFFAIKHFFKFSQKNFIENHRKVYYSHFYYWLARLLVFEKDVTNLNPRLKLAKMRRTLD